MFIRRSLLMSACCLALSSCYFNSAGHIINSGSYMAKVNTNDAKPGQVIYQKGSRYYAELSRYRHDSKVITQYSVFEQNTSKMDKSYQGKQMCQIPEDYALYLTGQSDTSVIPAFLRPVDNDSEIKEKGTKLPIVRQGEYKDKVFEYSSSAMPLLWSAAVLDWLCVDLPVTCVENALMVVVCYCEFWRKVGEADLSSHGSSSSGGNSSGDTYRMRQEQNEQMLRESQERSRRQLEEVDALRYHGMM